jgi:hypothetical protein
MSLDNALNETVSSVPEAVAAGYIDLATGMLLGIKTVDSQPAKVIDILAAATADLFQGPNVVMIEQIFKKSRDIDDEHHHYFQEFIVNSDNLVHLFLRGKVNSEHVLCVVCRKSVNLGMAITKSRQAIMKCEKVVA